MTTTEKIQSAGKALYMVSVPNNEIARTLGVSETTVSNWVTKGNWRDERADANNKKKARVEQVGDVVDYMFEVLHQQIRHNRERAKQYAAGERVRATARAMFMVDVSQKEILQTLNISDKDFKQWAKEGFWMERRQNIDDEALLRPVDKGDIDALTKIFSQLKGKEVTFDMVVTQVRELIDFINQRKPELAKDLVPFTTDYLMAKKEVLAI